MGKHTERTSSFVSFHIHQFFNVVTLSDAKSTVHAQNPGCRFQAMQLSTLIVDMQSCKFLGSAGFALAASNRATEAGPAVCF